MARLGQPLPGFMEDPEMGLLIATVLVFAVGIFWGAMLLEWIFKKITPKTTASLGRVLTTVASVSVTTGVFMYVATRPMIVGPYEQWTFENIGGQVIAGVLVAGLKIWIGGKIESANEAKQGNPDQESSLT